MILSLLLILLSGEAGPASDPFAPVTPAEFERIKISDDLRHAEARRDANRDAVRDAALQRRGHSGDLAYLQGCDLSDQDADFTVGNLALIAASPDWDSYTAALRAADIAAQGDEPSTDAAAQTIARAAALRDQAARRLVAAPLPDGRVGEAVLGLRLVSMCRMDFANGRWLDSSAARNLFATSTDQAVLHDLWLLAIHADHLPRLQDNYADIYLARRAELGLPIEHGLRLKDRAQNNLGLPQPYATGVICEAGKPVFAGKTDLDEANRLRVLAGLAPQDLAQKAAEKFCG